MPKLLNLDSNNIDSYLDSSEKFLENFFLKPEKDSYREIVKELSKANLPWSVRYHLSPQRHMLFSWYPFNENSTLLEMGAECGALTGGFLDKQMRVDCCEPFLSRATIIQNRFSNNSDMNIFVGNAGRIPSERKYDYVTIIGATNQVYPDSGDEQSYSKLLITAKKHLKNDGHLLLAIDNKLGLKYLSGFPDEHTGRTFDSINNYPQNSNIWTFSKTELTRLLNHAGFTNLDFYYPFPDYRFPQTVFSEEGLSFLQNLSKSAVLQIHDSRYAGGRLFNETALGYTLLKENIFQYFVNSFFVDAHE